MKREARRHVVEKEDSDFRFVHLTNNAQDNIPLKVGKFKGNEMDIPTNIASKQLQYTVKLRYGQVELYTEVDTRKITRAFD